MQYQFETVGNFQEDASPEEARIRFTQALQESLEERTSALLGEDPELSSFAWDRGGLFKPASRHPDRYSPDFPADLGLTSPDDMEMHKLLELMNEIVSERLAGMMYYPKSSPIPIPEISGEQQINEELRRDIRLYGAGIDWISKLLLEVPSPKMHMHLAYLILEHFEEIESLADKLYREKGMRMGVLDSGLVQLAIITMTVISPLMKLYDLHPLVAQLENSAFRVMNPEYYKSLSEKYGYETDLQTNFKYVQDEIRTILSGKFNTGEVEVVGRIKSLLELGIKTVEGRVLNVHGEMMVGDAIGFTLVVEDNLIEQSSASGKEDGDLFEELKDTVLRELPGLASVLDQDSSIKVPLPYNPNYRAIKFVILVGGIKVPIEIKIMSRTMFEIASRDHEAYKKVHIFRDEDIPREHAMEYKALCDHAQAMLGAWLRGDQHLVHRFPDTEDVLSRFSSATR